MWNPDCYNLHCSLHIPKIYSQNFVKSNVSCFQYVVTECRATSKFCGRHGGYSKIRQSLEELQMQDTITHSNNSIQKVLEIKCLDK